MLVLFLFLYFFSISYLICHAVTRLYGGPLHVHLLMMGAQTGARDRRLAAAAAPEPVGYLGVGRAFQR